ncbi:hypothetical protein LJC64_05335 [Ruminococcaceae bacterium OttesenSCG-928-A11]|nr:hypothetical protein [Ruminococcaceae bacterium OttesenSCG-928-A11]
MCIWTIEKWKKIIKNDSTRRTGLRVRFEKDVNAEVRRACISFCKWLRSKYNFPIRVPIYIKASKKIIAMDDERVYATFFAPFNLEQEPYIRVATGTYVEDALKYGKDNALAGILVSIAHELTHYFQWINGIKLTPIGTERQATMHSRWIIDEYKLTRDHP